ncbi:MAG: hypothetical protein HYW47_03575 [Deltaproteobacteria bacterium]|nr:hypothetical protein [Deltaproteobacteria bacterium]
MKVGRFLFFFLFSGALCAQSIINHEKSYLWPEIDAYFSEHFINNTIKKALSENKTVKRLSFKFDPLERLMTVDLDLHLSLERLVDPTSTVEAYLPLNAQVVFKPEVMKNGGLGILFKSLTLGIGEEKLEPIKELSFFINLFKILLLETDFGDLVQDKINLAAAEMNRLQELIGSSFEVHLETILIKKDIQFVGNSVLIKLKLEELFQGDAMDMSALEKPRLWALEPSLDFNHVPPQQGLYLAIGETVEDDPETPQVDESQQPVFKKALKEKRQKIREYLSR